MVDGEIILNKIDHLTKDVSIVDKKESQPHSTLYYFSCGCIVNSEFRVSKEFYLNGEEANYRQWIVACNRHSYLEKSNVSFRKAYQIMMDREKGVK